jgi:hypothetical protein
VRDNAGWKHQARFLRRGINRSQQASPCEASAARFRIDHDLAHSRKVNHQAAVACAETCEAMPATADGGENPDLSGCSDCLLHIGDVSTTRNQARRAVEHAVPDETRIFEAPVSRTQQIAVESPVKRRVNFLAGFDHFGRSLRDVVNLG